MLRSVSCPGIGRCTANLRRAAAGALVAIACVAMATPASARAYPDSVPLPVDFQPEGIAVGPGSVFYVSSIASGDIYRGDLRTGTGAVFVDAPTGSAALGLKVDQSHHLLFVAGGPTGAAYVYDTDTGASVATYQFAPAGASLLNDVVVTRDAAYFTDSFAPVLYKIPIDAHGTLGAGSVIVLTGPAASFIPGAFNLNGIDATPDGSTLIVSHSELGQLFTIDPVTGSSEEVDVAGLVPGTLDGLLLQGRTLWVVENFANTLVGVTLSPDLSSGTITSVIQSPLFQVPATVARHGDRLALVNTRFDLGFPPPFGPGAPPGTEFNVAVVRAH
jgi:sugar lactone lactonase YvrE